MAAHSHALFIIEPITEVNGILLRSGIRLLILICPLGLKAFLCFISDSKYE